MSSVVRSREHREAMQSRLRLLSRGVSVVLAGVVIAYWIVQGVHGAEYRDLAEHNRLRKEPVTAARGVIADRYGRPLAENVPSYTLVLHRSRADSLDASLAFASEVVGIPREQLAEIAESRDGDPLRPVRLAGSLTLAQVARFELATLEHPEFEIRVEQLRLYRHREQTAHLLGYLSEIGPEELAGSAGTYSRGDLVGRRGIESRYEPVLRGRNGEREIVVDSRGRTVAEYRYEAAATGDGLRLAIDLDLQQTAHRMLEGRVGAIVALDPKTGEILVMTSSPSYDPNEFVRRLDPRDWQALVSAPHHPLQNRAIQNAHSPGSIFKVVMALAGLSEGAVTPEETVWCGGSSTFYNHRFRCWKRAGHGRVDLRRALEESCDVYFYNLGQELGIERIATAARAFGLGRKTGIDLGGEKPGLVPDPEWSLRVRGHPWYPGETISVSIGQGPVLVTPLQQAVLMAAVANQGALPKPRVLRGDRGDAAGVVDLPREAWKAVHEGLVAVVEEGTGRTASLDGVVIAGKTGTVQVVSQSTWTDSEDLPYEERDHAWFAAYAPADDPRLVVVVFVEHGGAGSRAAAPIARVIYEEFFEKRPDLRGHPAS